MHLCVFDRLVDMHQLLIWKVRLSARCVAFVTPLSSRSMKLSGVLHAPFGCYRPCWYGSLDAVGKCARTGMPRWWFEMRQRLWPVVLALCRALLVVWPETSVSNTPVS